MASQGTAWGPGLSDRDSLVELLDARATDRGDEHAILLVEQNFSFASALGDRYYILDQGEIVSDGSMASLDENEELRAEYLGVT